MSADLLEQRTAESSGRDKKSRSHALGWTALALSLAALISGVLPHYLFGEPLPNPFERRPNPPVKAKVAPPLVVINGDKLADKLDDAKEAVGQNAADAKARVGKWAKGLKQKVPFLKGADQPDEVADALLPENLPRLDQAEPQNQPQAVKAPDQAVQPAKNPPVEVPNDAPWTPSRTLLMAAVLLAIASLPVAMASWIYEQQRTLPIAAVCCGTLAVTWQYLILGIIIGLALAIFLFVFGKLIQMFG